MAACERCLWFGLCRTSEPCDHFTPIEEDFEQAVEQARSEFTEAWFDYIDCEV